jgi:sporulation protein YlmC with PRC-barrel domain
MERMVEHVELETIRPGMAVVSNGHEIGRVEDLILQPDRLHVLRLITCRTSTGKRIAIPIDWVRGIQDGRVMLLVSERELDLLPEYTPALSVPTLRTSVPRTLDSQSATERMAASSSDPLQVLGLPARRRCESARD